MPLTPEETVSLVQDMLADPAAQKMLQIDSQANDHGIDSDERGKLVLNMARFLWSAPAGKGELYRAYLKNVAEVLSDFSLGKTS